MRDAVLRPEFLAVMAESTHNHVYGYRYLEPEHLVEPWTPALLNIQWVHAMVADYSFWNKLGDHSWLWWDGPNVSDPTATTGKRVFQVALHTFRQAGLDDWVTWVEAQRDGMGYRTGSRCGTSSTLSTTSLASTRGSLTGSTPSRT